jgi:hypothetical protein
MRTSSFYLLTSLSIFLLAFGCKTEKQDLEVETIADYIPLQTGKYITYRLDSLVFTNSGRREETHSYQEKHTVDAQIMDNLGVLLTGYFDIYEIPRQRNHGVLRFLFHNCSG